MKKVLLLVRYILRARKGRIGLFPYIGHTIWLKVGLITGGFFLLATAGI